MDSKAWAEIRPRKRERAICITLGGRKFQEFRRDSPGWVTRVPGVRSNGHDGVSIAHLAQYRDALNDGITLLTVFEDDARLNRELTRNDRDCIRRFRRDPRSRILMLGYSWQEHDMQRVSASRTTGYAVDFHAYMITAAGMREFLAVFPPLAEYSRILTMGSIDTYTMTQPADGLAYPLFVQADNRAYDAIRKAPYRRCDAIDSRIWFLGARVCHSAFFAVYGWDAWSPMLLTATSVLCAYLARYSDVRAALKASRGSLPSMATTARLA